MENFKGFPIEIWQDIIKSVEVSGLYILLRVSKPLHHISIDILYKKDAASPTPKALHWAAEFGLVDVLRRSLKAGAEVMERNADDETALHCAGRCHTRVQEVIEELLAHESDIDALAMGVTPLETACASRNLQAAGALIKAGSLRGRSLNGPLLSDLADQPVKATTMSDNDAQADLRLRHDLMVLVINGGYNVDWYPETEKDGHSALVRAIQMGDLSTVRLLLDNGADPNLRNRDSRTPLMEAVLQRKPDCVQLLLDRGVDIGAVDVDGCSVWYHLTLADDDDAVRICQLLVDGLPNQRKFESNGSLLQFLEQHCPRCIVKGSSAVVDAGYSPSDLMEFFQEPQESIQQVFMHGGELTETR